MPNIPEATVTHPHLHEILTKLRDYLAQAYGDRLDQVILFGSQARGDATPDSDIDILIALRGSVDPCSEIHRTSEFIADLCLEYTVLVSCIFVSAEQFEAKQDAYFYRNVHREGILI